MEKQRLKSISYFTKIILLIVIISNITKFISLIKRFYFRLRKKYFPTEQEKTILQWHSDNRDIKLRLSYPLDEKSIILDVGGYEGQWASDIFSKYQSQIYVFEPIESYSSKIKSRFEKNNSIKVLSYGLGASSREDLIYLADDGSSLLRKSEETEKVQIVDISKWILENNLKHISLIKMNIEGAEYELLQRLLDTNLISIIDNLQIQFHNISKDSYKKLQKIRKQLSVTHKTTYQYDFVWENWTKI